MSMKDHILTALREQFDQLDELLASLSEEQITTPNFDDNWSIKDAVNHLWVATDFNCKNKCRVHNREPEFPNWLINFPGNWDESATQTNAWIYKTFTTNHGQKQIKTGKKVFFNFLT
ncbi:MAG: hypothetical protein IPN96_10275 [Anaerolineales bacterium]|nr:hypothetical protein [Anaerolineales bacterium]